MGFIKRSLAATVAAGLASILVHTSAEAAPVYSTIAISGTHAPGTPVGATFTSFGTPVLNASGKTAFSANLVTGSGGVTLGSDAGIWSEGSGTLNLVAREGNNAPGTPVGANFNTFNAPVLSAGGKTAFSGTLLAGSGGVTSSSNTGIWSEAGGTLTLVAREGSQAPGTAAGANFDSFNDPVINASGKIAFSGALQTGSGGVVIGTNDDGIWSEGSGTLGLVGRRGSQAPDAPAGANFSSFAFTLPVINASGKTAFSTPLQTGSGGVTSSNDGVLWSEGAGTLALVAREQNQAPGTPAGATFSSFADPVINASGKTAFTGFLSSGSGGVNFASNDRGLWSEGSGTLALMARSGDQAPGTPAGAIFSSAPLAFGPPVINANGRTAFIGSLVAGNGGVTSGNDSGLWSEGSGTLTLIAREGSQAPGTPAGANFNAISNPVINASGKTAFLSTLVTGAGGVTSSNNTGLWAEDPAGLLTLIVRKGDLFQVAPGDSRTISGIAFTAVSGGEDGRGMSFNDQFDLTFKLTFTDSSSGIFTASIPEPAGLSLLGLATGTLLVRRRKGPTQK